MRHYIKQFVKVVITGIIFAILAQIIHSEEHILQQIIILMMNMLVYGVN